jgi:hypothetical protein
MKKTLYPKTGRIWTDETLVTEKLDWSNLWIFILGWRFLIAQRNNLFYLDEPEWESFYKWLLGWLNENKASLVMHEWSWVFWEWMWMWSNIKYWDTLDKKFYIFAKANIDEEFNIRNLNYWRHLLIYPFIDSAIPECIWVVPLVTKGWDVSVSNLDEMYEQYTERVKRKVEWFVVTANNNIAKYVRYKDGKETKHKF